MQNVQTQLRKNGRSASKNVRRLRVLYVDHTAKLGGGEIALLNLLNVIDQTKIEPLVLLFSDGPLRDRLEAAGIDVHLVELEDAVLNARKDSLGLSSLARLKEVSAILRQIKRVATFIREHDIDLVHTNSLKSDVIAGLAARQAGVKCLWHIRDRLDENYLPSLVAKVFAASSRLIPYGLIANSESTLSTIVSKKQVRDRAWVVHDGVEESAFAPHRAADNTEKTIGLIGRISPWKGQHIFIQAAKEIHSLNPDVRFRIIGSALFDETDYQRELEELVTRLKLNNVVEFAGFRSDVYQAIAELDIVVHASTSGEPFGQVIVEAMAAGKPVIATNGGGVPEIVQHQVTGILIAMSDVQAMADAVKYLLENPEEASRMGAAGRERVKENFTVALTARRIERVYEQLSCKNV